MPAKASGKELMVHPLLLRWDGCK